VVRPRLHEGSYGNRMRSESLGSRRIAHPFEAATVSSELGPHAAVTQVQANNSLRPVASFRMVFFRAGFGYRRLSRRYDRKI
jgi:hypothetical protein